MTKPLALAHFRDAVLDDAWLLAELETAIVPDDPRDGEMIAFWWCHPLAGERNLRLINVEDGAASAFIIGGHNEWQDGETRFGNARMRLHPDLWNEETFAEGVNRGESWLRDEGGEVAFARVRDSLTEELSALGRLGYREDRRNRLWRLDLVAHRDRLLAGAEKTRAEMRGQGLQLLTLDRDTDPERMTKLYELDLETTEDVPKSVPWPVPTFEEWHSQWFENPAHHEDRFWIAREGDEILGLSIIGYPPRRGHPWTSFTCTARRARGRGIARALKYETVAQAIALGATRVKTDNDAANAPILHLNEEMGYEPVGVVIELHHRLDG